jgi:2'-hydroxyisoflavone reductase
MLHRREFVKRSLIATVASVSSPWSFSPVLAAAPAPKRVLVLGGTSFLGPALVDAAVANGHTVTLFNRGITNPGLFPYLERLRGFRSADVNDQDLSALGRRHFDVIVDVWPNDPTIAASAAEFLGDHTSHYLYVSSVAAYDSAGFSRPGIQEDAPLEPWEGSGRRYNRGKAESERRLHRILGDKLTVVRPGPIKGERDDTPDLLTWLTRSQRGGRHIAPGTGADPVELVDVKDVARFMVMAIEQSFYGTFNLTGRSMSFREFLENCKAATRSEAEFVWIPQDFLRTHRLETDSTLGIFAGNFPFWRPTGAMPGLFQVSSEKAFRAGWRTRSFEETAWDCLTSFRSQGATLAWSDYLPAEKEKQVLDAWEHRSG